MNVFPARLRELRGTASQAATAQKLDITQSSYARYEKGDRQPSPDLLCRISRFFNVSIDWLLGQNGIIEKSLKKDSTPPSPSNQPSFVYETLPEGGISEWEAKALYLEGVNKALNDELTRVYALYGKACDDLAKANARAVAETRELMEGIVGQLLEDDAGGEKKHGNKKVRDSKTA